ncbi:Cj0814 family flagellar-dependent secreted protein, partial [Campylobacter sp. MIT 97-5078]|uniref:Cj0814 family flagellar-dependent secreted protein n=1 Tax=Campylobacter sp. MIT 97-5078 TaxID=1548153 RepID=UPI00068CBD34
MRIDNSFLSNTYSSLKQEKGLYFENKAKNESEVVGQVLGYGVDKEGFFTSDFNEAAGLPQDYKIYAKGMENLVNYLTTNSGAFTNIDIAKSLGRAYQVFSQLAPKVEGNFTQEDISNIPQWFQWNEQTLRVTKTYTKEEYISATSARNEESAYNVLKNGLSFSSLNKLSVDFIDKNADIFEPSRKFNIGENMYKNADTISKGGILMAFFAGSQNIHFFRGETTISGKLAGLDDNFSVGQRKELADFMENNPISYSITGDIGKDLINLLTLTDKFTNVDEFKQEWLKMKAKSNEAQMENQNTEFNFSSIFNSLRSNKAINVIKSETKPFKPI